MLNKITSLILFLSFSSCSGVPIADMQVFSPIPGHLGAVSDYTLHSEQKILTEQEWEDQQSDWAKQGMATECVSSRSIGAIKASLEKLCSEVTCDYMVKQKVISGLNKIESLGLTPKAQ